MYVEFKATLLSHFESSRCCRFVAVEVPWSIMVSCSGSRLDVLPSAVVRPKSCKHRSFSSTDTCSLVYVRMYVAPHGKVAYSAWSSSWYSQPGDEGRRWAFHDTTFYYILPEIHTFQVDDKQCIIDTETLSSPKIRKSRPSTNVEFHLQ